MHGMEREVSGRRWVAVIGDGNQRTAPHRRHALNRDHAKTIVEPVFGQIKQACGFRPFLMRGLAKVHGEWALVCLTHNILKLASAPLSVTIAEMRHHFQPPGEPALQWILSRLASSIANRPNPEINSTGDVARTDS